MRTGGWVRTLKYFVRYAEIYVLGIIAGSFAMVAYMWLINGYDVSFREALEFLPITALWISLVIIFTSGITSYQYWYSMPVSFGCIRKNAFFGNMVMDLLVMGESLAFYFLMSALFDQNTQANEVVIILAVFFCLEGFGKLIGIAVMKWGKAAYVLMVIVILVFAMGVGFFVGYGGGSGKFISVTALLGEDLVQTGKWIILFVSVVICAAAHGVNWRMLRSFEVKV